MYKNLACLLLVFTLAGCSALGQFFNPPGISLQNIELIETSGLSARFGINLRVTNPNPIPMPVQGLSYQLSLNGFSLIEGVASSIGELPAYGETSIRLEASTNLAGMLGLFAQLMSGTVETFEYDLSTEVSVRGLMRPIQIADKGEIRLN